jgi:hypothetical protein
MRDERSVNHSLLTASVTELLASRPASKHSTDFDMLRAQIHEIRTALTSPTRSRMFPLSRLQLLQYLNKLQWDTGAASKTSPSPTPVQAHTESLNSQGKALH